MGLFWSMDLVPGEAPPVPPGAIMLPVPIRLEAEGRGRPALRDHARGPHRRSRRDAPRGRARIGTKGCTAGLRPSRRALLGAPQDEGKALMALRKFLILRRPPPGPRVARPEDRLRGRLEGRTAPIQPTMDFLPGLHAIRTGGIVGTLFLPPGPGPHPTVMVVSGGGIDEFPRRHPGLARLRRARPRPFRRRGSAARPGQHPT